MGILDDLLGDVEEEVAPTQERPVIPKGIYTALLTNATLDVKGADKITTLDLEFQITSGDFQGRRLWQTVWFNPPSTQGQKTAMAITIKALDVPKAANSDDWEMFAENVAGYIQELVDKQTFKVQVFGHREYEGKTYERASVQSMFNESEVHKGVENMAPKASSTAPSFDASENLPF